MKSAETIKDLNLNYVEGPITMPRKYFLLNERIDALQKQLKQKMHNKKDKKKIDKLVDMLMETSSMESDEYFVSGFVLATRIMSEVLNYKV
jgi:hypothetical protein